MWLNNFGRGASGRCRCFGKAAALNILSRAWHFLEVDAIGFLYKDDLRVCCGMRGYIEVPQHRQYIAASKEKKAEMRQAVAQDVRFLQVAHWLIPTGS